MNLPLTGLKIIDLSRVLAGPFASQHLADMGADVIKIEHPKGDDTRQWGPPFIGDSAAYYYSANRNKRSRSCDFTSSSDLVQLDSLIANADILLENFKPGTLAKYGLDYDSLKIKYPALIYSSITGFGSKGPYAHKPGYDAMIQSMSGLMSITGTTNQEPVKVGVAVTDLYTGLNAVTAILAAVIERSRSGLGQHLEISLLESQISMLSYMMVNFLQTEELPSQLGTAHPTIVPYQLFDTSDHKIFIAIGNDQQFHSFSLALNQNWHENKLYFSNRDRVTHRDQLIPLIESQLNQQTTAYWLNHFKNFNFPHAPYNNLKQVSNDPHIQDIGIIGTMTDSSIPNIANPIHFSRTPITTYSTPPSCNAHPDAQFNS